MAAVLGWTFSKCPAERKAVTVSSNFKETALKLMTAVERKQNTERLLKTLSIPFIDHLPLIEEEHEARIRTPQEVAKRILVLTYLNYVSKSQTTVKK